MEAPGLLRIEFLDANLARHKRAEIEAFIRTAVAQVRRLLRVIIHEYFCPQYMAAAGSADSTASVEESKQGWCDFAPNSRPFVTGSITYFDSFCVDTVGNHAAADVAGLSSAEHVPLFDQVPLCIAPHPPMHDRRTCR